jgi:hypothetical protein
MMLSPRGTQVREVGLQVSPLRQSVNAAQAALSPACPEPGGVSVVPVKSSQPEAARSARIDA